MAIRIPKLIGKLKFETEEPFMDIINDRRNLHRIPELQWNLPRTAQYVRESLEKLGCRVFYGDHQLGTVSFVPKGDCEEVAEYLSGWGICLRAGLHCAPFAHESAGTLDTGTVRVSFGWENTDHEREKLLKILEKSPIQI